MHASVLATLRQLPVPPVHCYRLALPALPRRHCRAPSSRQMATIVHLAQTTASSRDASGRGHLSSHVQRARIGMADRAHPAKVSRLQDETMVMEQCQLCTIKKKKQCIPTLVAIYSRLVLGAFAAISCSLAAPWCLPLTRLLLAEPLALFASVSVPSCLTSASPFVSSFFPS